MRKVLTNLGAKINKGGLHRSLGMPEGEKIGMARIKKAERSSDPLTRKQAFLAETFAHHRPGAKHAHG